MSSITRGVSKVSDIHGASHHTRLTLVVSTIIYHDPTLIQRKASEEVMVCVNYTIQLNSVFGQVMSNNDAENIVISDNSGQW